MTVVLAGCGDLGTEAALRFAALGHHVLGLRRSAEKLPASIDGVSIDLGATRPTLPADTEIVVVALSAGSRDVDTYRASYVDGLRNVLDALDEAGAVDAQVLFVSSTAVYDVDDGSVVDETTPATGASPTAEVILEAEALLHARRPDGIVLRLGGIYGPGRERLITQVRDGGRDRAPHHHLGADRRPVRGGRRRAGQARRRAGVRGRRTGVARAAERASSGSSGGRRQAVVERTTTRHGIHLRVPDLPRGVPGRDRGRGRAAPLSRAQPGSGQAMRACRTCPAGAGRVDHARRCGPGGPTPAGPNWGVTSPASPARTPPSEWGTAWRRGAPSTRRRPRGRRVISGSACHP